MINNSNIFSIFKNSNTIRCTNFIYSAAEKRLRFFKRRYYELLILLILFDELGLSESSGRNSFNILHSKFDYAGKEEGYFVGICNYSLDAAKINRINFIYTRFRWKIWWNFRTSHDIILSISDKIINYKIFEIFSNTYFENKIKLIIIKELVVYKQLNKAIIKKQRNKSSKPEVEEIDKN